jgi:hypothetical protein
MVYSFLLFRFEHSCVAYDKEAAKYAVAYSQLDKFQADRTPRYLQYVLIQDHPPGHLVIKKVLVYSICFASIDWLTIRIA